MNRNVITFMTIVASTLFAHAAHASLVCEDAVSQNGADAAYQWDELPPASSALFLGLERCACGSLDYGTSPPTATLGACSAACSFTDGSNDWGCGLIAGVCDPALDPTCDFYSSYVWKQAQADDCAACVATTCADESAACMADSSTP